MRPGTTFSRTLIAEDREKLSSYYQDQGYAYANVLAADQGRSAEPQDQPDLRGRARQAGVLRADQHPRQLEDPRQGDPPRDEDRRGRAVQQHQPRGLQAPDHGARLLRERRRSRPSAAARTSSSRSTSRSASGRPARSRSAPGSRRSRTSSPRPRSRRTTCSAAARPCRSRPSCRACASCSCCGSSSRTSSTRCGRSAFDLYNQSIGFGTFFRNSSGGQLTWGYPLSYEARAFLIYKLEDVSITTGSGGISNLGATSTPIAGGQRREPVPRRLDLVAARLAAVGLAQQPAVPDRRLVRHAVRWSSPTSTPARRTSSCAGAASSATTASCGGRSCSTATPRSGSRPRPIRSACRSASATWSAASSTSAATRRARSGRSC